MTPPRGRVARRPLDVARVEATRSPLGHATLTATLRLDADVDALHVHRRLLELVEDLGDEHSGRRERGELP